MPNWLRLASCLVAAAGALEITDLNGEWAWEYAESVENDGKTEFFCVDASSGRVDSLALRNEYTRGFVVAASDGTGDLYYHQYYISGGAFHDQGHLMCKVSATDRNRCVGSYHSDTENALTDTKPFTFVRVDQVNPPVKPNPEQCFQVSAAMDRAFITNRGSVDPLFTMNGFWGSAVNPSQWACVEGDRWYSSYEYIYKEDGKPDRKVNGYSAGYVRFGGQVASVVWYEPDALGDEIITLVSENQLRLSWFLGAFDATKLSDPVESGVDMLTRFTTDVFPGDCEKYACALSGCLSGNFVGPNGVPDPSPPPPTPESDDDDDNEDAVIGISVGLGIALVGLVGVIAFQRGRGESALLKSRMRSDSPQAGL